MSGLSLFQAHGVEIEYAIVDRTTLDVRALADQALTALAGELSSEVELGPITCSNELALHVLELKTTRPEPRLEGLANQFAEGVARLNAVLEPLGACLLPSAMHPWMDPEREALLWPHEQNEIYDAFDRLFGAGGHGWTNLQSVHLNLPYQGNDELGRLHAAIRLVLPLLPALAASSPMVEGELSGLCDSRMSYYGRNSALIPSIAGQVIPEAVFTTADYQTQILDVIGRDLRQADPEGVLEPEWTNSRGAIVRFIRDSIEIRVIDSQEAPCADLAVVAITSELVRGLCEERWSQYSSQTKARTEDLKSMLDRTVVSGGEARIDDPTYLALLGVSARSYAGSELWQQLCERLIPKTSEFHAALEVMTREGTLAQRLKRALGKSPSREQTRRVYRQLADCLRDNRMFSRG